MSDSLLARETPSGWSSSVLGDVATLQRGFDLPIQNRTEGCHPVYGSNGIDGFNDKAMLSGPGVITGRSGTIGLVHYEESAYWPLNTTLYVKHFHGNDERYIYYFLQTLNLSRFVAATGVPSLNRNFVHPLPVVMPPLPQQRKIARVLTTVDNLIEKTEALIAKYQAIKQGIMHDLFTRGMDEHGHLRPPYEQAPELYKPSELGWIPKEWEAKALCSVTMLITKGATPTTYGFDFVDEGVRFIRGENLSKNGDYSHGEKWITEEANNFLRRSIVKPNDLILGIVGTLGNYTVASDDLLPANISQNVALIRCDSSAIVPMYLSCFLQTRWFKAQVEAQVTVQAQPSINLGQVGDFSIALPCIDEQKRLVERLVAIDRKLHKETTFRDKFRLQKTGLMQDLLTGKVRVNVNEAEEVGHV